MLIKMEQHSADPTMPQTLRLPGYGACTLPTWPKGYPLSQVARAQDQYGRRVTAALSNFLASKTLSSDNL